MTTELILAITGCFFGVIGTLFGVATSLTSARKDRVETILAVLNELEEQYLKLKARYEELEAAHLVLKSQYESLQREYEKLCEHQRKNYL